MFKYSHVYGIMGMPSLSKAEKDFIEGKLKPNPNYRRVLIHRIKKKRQKMVEELKLIEKFLGKLKKNEGAL
jgi:hypothetical protein